VLTDELKSRIKDSRYELVRLISDLVRLPTENKPPNGNEGIGQEWLKERCLEAGLETELYELEDVPGFKEHPDCWPREFKGRPNLIAKWNGSGGGRSLMFSGHMDVVPPYPLPWNLHEPFEPVLEGNKLYGRGAGDMKGGLVAAYLAIKLLKESGFQPRGDVLFESVVDEEYAGANGTLAGRLRGDNADFVIIPEPCGMTVRPVCFGAKLDKISVTGPAGMPYSGYQIYNPIYGLSRVIQALEKFEKHWNDISPKHPMFEEPLNVIIYKLKAGQPQMDGQMTVPPEAWLSVIIQTMPGTTEEEIDIALKEFLDKELADSNDLKEHPPTVTKEFRYMVPGDMSADHEAIRMLVDAGKSLGREIPVKGGPYSCDLFVFHQFDVPAVLFGARSDNSHGKDEWVNVDDLVELVAIYAQAICDWCG